LGKNEMEKLVILLAMVSLLVVSGCSTGSLLGEFGWTRGDKTSFTKEEFDRDSFECKKSVRSYGGWVYSENYIRRMQEKGWSKNTESSPASDVSK
jgi:hypothetical protein